MKRRLKDVEIYYNYGMAVGELQKLNNIDINIEAALMELNDLGDQYECAICLKHKMGKGFQPVVLIDKEFTIEYIKEQKNKIQLLIQKQQDIINEYERKYGLHSCKQTNWQ